MSIGIPLSRINDRISYSLGMIASAVIGAVVARILASRMSGRFPDRLLHPGLRSQSCQHTGDVTAARRAASVLYIPADLEIRRWDDRPRRCGGGRRRGECGARAGSGIVGERELLAGRADLDAEPPGLLEDLPVQLVAGRQLLGRRVAP